MVFEPHNSVKRETFNCSYFEESQERFKLQLGVMQSLFLFIQMRNKAKKYELGLSAHTQTHALYPEQRRKGLVSSLPEEDNY